LEVDLQEDLLIIYDDFHLPFGTLRFRAKGSDAGHNGIKSIIYELESELFSRLKIGAGDAFSDAVDFVLSDFIDDGYEQTLKIIGNKHDVTGIRIYDKRETEIPNLGMVTMQDAETNEVLLVNTASRKVRHAYKSHYLEQKDYFENAFKRSGAGFINTETNESYVKKLLLYFKQKGAR